MTKPRYVRYCEAGCLDKNNQRKAGTTWIHLDGRTMWVCLPCSRRLIPEDADEFERKLAAATAQRRVPRPSLPPAPLVDALGLDLEDVDD